MHNSFILQQYVCYTTILNMFRAARCLSSGGQIMWAIELASAVRTEQQWASWRDLGHTQRQA